MAADFELYRAAVRENPSLTSIETPGIIFEADFQRVMDDPNTATIKMPGHEDIAIPLLTPFANRLNWFNPDFYSAWLNNRLSGAYYYNHLEIADFKLSIEAVAVLSRLASEKGVILLDHSEGVAGQVDNHLNALLARLGLKAADIVAPANTDPTHYHFAAKAYSGGQSRASLYGAYLKTVNNGELDPGPSIAMYDVMEPEDIEAGWQFYEPVFNELSQNDPVNSGLTEHEFAEVAGSADFTKVVFRSEGEIVNLCIFSDVRNCDWMNQDYYKHNFPDEYEAGQVFCSIGVITNPNAKNTVAASLRTMGLFGKVIMAAGLEPVVTFACNTVSRKQVPVLAERALQRVGLRTEVSRQVGAQLFRAMEIVRV